MNITDCDGQAWAFVGPGADPPLILGYTRVHYNILGYTRVHYNIQECTIMYILCYIATGTYSTRAVYSKTTI